jgi:hypothetical protein
VGEIEGLPVGDEVVRVEGLVVGEPLGIALEPELGTALGPELGIEL